MGVILAKEPELAWQMTTTLFLTGSTSKLKIEIIGRSYNNNVLIGMIIHSSKHILQWPNYVPRQYTRYRCALNYVLDVDFPLLGKSPLGSYSLVNVGVWESGYFQRTTTTPSHPQPITQVVRSLFRICHQTQQYFWDGFTLTTNCMSRLRGLPSKYIDPNLVTTTCSDGWCDKDVHWTNEGGTLYTCKKYSSPKHSSSHFHEDIGKLFYLFIITG